jgi:hypothetical protein
LPDLYDQLVVAANSGNVERVGNGVGAIVADLTSPAITLLEW